MLIRIVIAIMLTTYNPCPEQGWGDGTITADGSKITNENSGWVAISHDLFERLKYDDVILIDGKSYKIKDKMNKRFLSSVDIMQSKDRKNFKKKSQLIIYLDVREYERRTGIKCSCTGYAGQSDYYSRGDASGSIKSSCGICYESSK